MPLTPTDERYMAACLRYSRRHHSLTGKNPSVATIIVQDGIVVARGITGEGGRPHSETEALSIFSKLKNKNGSCAYISLEPCSHHGSTPPCVDALLSSGIERIVTTIDDPDARVSGRGHKKLIESGIELEQGCLADDARQELHRWLSYKVHNRPHITLKVAISKDGYIGKEGESTQITNDLSRRHANRLRAEYDAILVGHTTQRVDNPKLTCRIKGLESRSPSPFVLTSESTITNLLSQMMSHDITSLLVEGGARTLQSFLESNLCDALYIYESDLLLGSGISSPLTLSTVPSNLIPTCRVKFGKDTLHTFIMGSF